MSPISNIICSGPNNFGLEQTTLSTTEFWTIIDSFGPIEGQNIWLYIAKQAYDFSPYFAGYYERLITGQLDFKWSPEDADAKRPSMATITSDSTPESDSIRTSLADISHGGGNL